MTRSIVTLFLVGACSASGGAQPSASDAPATPGQPPPVTSTHPATAPPSVPTATAVATPHATPRARPTAVPGVSMPELVVGTVAVTVADEGVRLRSLPGIDDVSQPYTPKLAMGTPLFVLDGPAEADGYHWYQVAPIGTSEPDEPWGWVAVASRDGVPWLEPGTADCPAVPADVRAVAALDFGTRVACFGGEAISFRARLLPCNCEMDPGDNIRPAMFERLETPEGGDPALGGGPLLLVPLGGAPGEPSLVDSALVRIASDADVPDTLPIGEDVMVTGMFDHPAAVDCRADEDYDGDREPSPTCRGLFLVTSIR